MNECSVAGSDFRDCVGLARDGAAPCPGHHIRWLRCSNGAVKPGLASFGGIRCLDEPQFLQDKTFDTPSQGCLIRGHEVCTGESARRDSRCATQQDPLR